ncbi:hypothetical protein GSI_04769 [Ganoderma sinense ZZ0214-1]|uniref:BTB domain-containing protein n=1 Tax=Ganoderma sinense ZZ0214-1 TaxID=1077348 RepID=A0A2G8SID1_9APHY|nr:hypothetical protein GSI_04769 [Ganoderma sinense ZZ0214-1]
MVLPSERTSMQGRNHNAFPCYSRDCDFFFNLSPLYLRAENTLFCVPRHYFQISDVFDGMFALPGVPNTPQEGSTEACPLFLESIKADELKDFLRVLFVTADPEDASSVPQIPTSWVSVLKLASLWQFTSVRKKALEHLKSEDCLSRFEISRHYGVPDWFLPALKDLIYRSEPLTADEILRLTRLAGLGFAVKMLAFREKALIRRYFTPRASGLGTSRRVVVRLPPQNCRISDEEIGRAFEVH